jgi:xanthine dehydrogenase iron-sulfur cluster and FAD-binding subunit A
MWKKYINASQIDEVLTVLKEYGEKARIVAGGTDLILEIERGIRSGIEVVVDVTRIPDLDDITLDEDDFIHLGPMVTHNHCVGSKLIYERAFPLAQAAWEVGAPQIRNRGTVAGNLITASPANDTITPLMALGAVVTLRSSDAQRQVPVDEFYLGVRKTVMQPDEMLVDISFPAMRDNQRGTFMKLGLRRAQAISVVDVAMKLTFEEDAVSEAAITLGAVAPTIIHAKQAEVYLKGRPLSDEVIGETARLTMEASTPIDDIRGSATYRREMVRVLTARGLGSISRSEEQLEYPTEPVLLWGQGTPGDAAKSSNGSTFDGSEVIQTKINGREYTFDSGYDKTLLDLVREEGALTGTKEGCAEGECGACTVYLDGIAVMGCLVPAPRAHGAEIVTIEGLADAETDRLHPVQDAFIHAGAVQCGYCTPGFLMSAAKLLEEIPQPSRDDVKQAITGNLCRCTGYYKIVEAIEKASQMEVMNG